jgi:hypothetical protein
MAKARATRCTGGARHWFTVVGAVGLRSPVCRRCGAPNPRITEDELAEYRAMVERGWVRDIGGWVRQHPVTGAS